MTNLTCYRPNYCVQSGIKHESLNSLLKNEPRHEETNNVVRHEQVRHELSCTSTEDGLNLEILDLESGGNLLSV